MFDRYLVEEGSLRNESEDGNVVGWAIGARIGYYRGLGLSMIELQLTRDGETVPQDRIHLRLHGAQYRLVDIGDVLDDRWGFNETVTIFVEEEGGLTEGPHEVGLAQSLRISYLAVPSVNRDRKVLIAG